MSLREYITTQFGLIPSFVYIMSLLIFVAGCFAFWRKNKSNMALHGIFTILLIEYVFVILCSTVIFRNTSDISRYHLIPFWSYAAKPYGHVLLMPETIVNIVMFIPIGILACIIIKGLGWKYAILLGACISCVIEILQFFFRKGVSEFDDVFHNTLGCIIGYGIYRLSRWHFGRLNSRGNE